MPPILRFLFLTRTGILGCYSLLFFFLAIFALEEFGTKNHIRNVRNDYLSQFSKSDSSDFSRLFDKYNAYDIYSESREFVFPELNEINWLKKFDKILIFEGPHVKDSVGDYLPIDTIGMDSVFFLVADQSVFNSLYPEDSISVKLAAITKDMSIKLSFNKYSGGAQDPKKRNSLGDTIQKPKAIVAWNLSGNKDSIQYKECIKFLSDIVKRDTIGNDLFGKKVKFYKNKMEFSCDVELLSPNRLLTLFQAVYLSRQNLIDSEIERIGLKWIVFLFFYFSFSVTHLIILLINRNNPN